VHRFFYLRLLRGSLVLGAVYDLAFAAIMVLAPQVASRALRLPLPGERFYLWVMAVMLAMLAALYLKAAQDPRRYSAVVLVAAAGRCAGAAAFAAAALHRPELDGLWVLAAADLVFGVAHAVLWKGQR
jgi:heme/copper-type cytochrome/quinol oxidase subunit 1